MTHVRAHYAEKPSQELVRLDSFDILHSPLAEPVDYARAAALAFFRRGSGADAARSRSARRCLPPVALGAGADPRRSHLDADHLFRPLDHASHGLAAGFDPLSLLRRFARRSACLFSLFSDGLVCVEHKQRGENGSYGVSLTPDSQLLAVRIFRSPASAFAAESWPRNRGADLRRFAIQSLERHLERKLTTAAALSRLGG
jgi:DNA repair protein RecO (recombination protein O)